LPIKIEQKETKMHKKKLFKINIKRRKSLKKEKPLENQEV
tara:strand:- start:2463 stop:2582 length:120 start_codon:yes stop_codon:yes gene_type:complete